MFRRRMGATIKDHGPVVEEIKGLIKFYKDGHVERLPAVPEVPCTWTIEPDVKSWDVVINHSTGVWARFYVPRCNQGQLLIYFHGGGFCVGSAAWSCYHEFLSRLASRAGCIIMSVNYRLAPEHRLPACYEDGLAAVKWVKQHPSYCNLNHVYLGGDSAGAAIAFNVATQVNYLKGLILIQPFFGGETRTASEKNMTQSSKSALTLGTSDSYWRMALPVGTDRDHPWSNPLGKRSVKLENLKLPPVFVCVSELDILKDRNMELCQALRKAGKSVEHAVYAGVGHGFQVLHNYHMSQARTQEMLAHITAFVNNYR